jgi:tetratricopeptide (TPR) repeat protein
VAPPEGSAEARAQAAQLSSTAEQSIILGDLQRAEALLERAAELDPASADLAYRRARVLEESGDPEGAVTEYCRAIALAGEGMGAGDARVRLDAIAAAERATLPEEALVAFEEGLAAVDRGTYGVAAEAFGAARNQSPLWAGAVYNHGIALDLVGRHAEAAEALLRYLELRPGAPDAIAISQRIGQLQSLAIGAGPSPGTALALGALVPGMGQFYSGRPFGGFAVLAVAGSAVAAGFLFEDIYVRCLNPVEPGGTCPPDQVVSRRTDRPHLMLGVGVAAAVGVIGAIEAFVHLRGRRSSARSFPAEGSAQLAGSGPVLEGPSVSTSSGLGRIDLNVLRLRFR